MPMTADSLTIAKRTGGLTVYVVPEGAAITPSDTSWGAISVAAKKRACLSYLSQELSDDALINIVDNIVLEMGHALADQEDNELINGNASSTYGGINGLLNAIGSAGVNTADADENIVGGVGPGRYDKHDCEATGPVLRVRSVVALLAPVLQ